MWLDICLQFFYIPLRVEGDKKFANRAVVGFRVVREWIDDGDDVSAGVGMELKFCKLGPVEPRNQLR